MSIKITGTGSYIPLLTKKNDDFILLSISIYDRYGKFIKQFNPYGQGWDGTINGELMPTSDYWYSAITTKGRSFNGHFT